MLAAMYAFILANYGWYLIVGFVLFYLIYTIECFIHERYLGRHWFWFPVQCFSEECLWNLPGGKERRAAAVQQMLALDLIDAWEVQYADEEGTSDELVNDLLPGKWHFIFYALMPFLWLIYLVTFVVLFLLMME